MTSPFRLDPAFVAKYKDRTPPFGFNGLGELVYLRTYSRIKPDGSKEQWYETVERVVNGCYNMQKRHIEAHSLGWSDEAAQSSSEEMYERIFTLKMCPPGRGLWIMGSPITEERGLFAALNNCGFVTTANIDIEFSKPFCFLKDLSMLGAGIGFDTKGAGKLIIQAPQPSDQTYVIPDSREGWVEALRLTLDAYLKPNHPKITLDYSAIRPTGQPIRGFGGTASGPDPLKKMLVDVSVDLDKSVGKPITVTDIVNIMNRIGCCVVAGNVRRSAELALGDPDSEEFVNLKNYEVNPQRLEYGWASNNSIFAEIGMDYSKIADRIASNGEPGILLLDNMRYYGRMNGVVDAADHRVGGANPCVEQCLEPYELCCLSEVFIARHDNVDDFLRTLKFAYLYAKTVTLGKAHWSETNRVLLRNRRIGTSVSGIAQFLARHNVEKLREWLEEGYAEIRKYDRIYADWLCIPQSVRCTSVKPSGTVSLLAGATPGCHYPESRFYIRRVRLANTSDLLPQLRAAGYHIEEDAYSVGTMVVSFPIDAGEGVRTIKDVCMWEQLSLVALLQRCWADNSVSATVTFDPVTEGPQIAHALNYFQYQLKAVSFLPRLAQGAYKQMPYEAIGEKTYQQMIEHLQSVKLQDSEDAEGERGCDGTSCTLTRTS